MSSQQQHSLVQIAGEQVQRDLQEFNPVHWQVLLKRAKDGGIEPTCLCRGSGRPLPMHIARRGRTYVLKKMPMGGDQHHPACLSYGTVAGLGRGKESTEALQKGSDGRLDIKLDVPLTTVISSNAGSRRDRVASEGTTSRNAVTVLGLLHVLWEKAGLNRWEPLNGAPPVRRLTAVYQKLDEELQDITFGRISGEQLIFVPDTRIDPADLRSKHDALHEQNRLLCGYFGSDLRPVLFVIGELRSAFQSRYGVGLRLKGLGDDATIWMGEKPAQALHGQITTAVNRMGRLQGHTMVLAGVQFSPKGSLNWNVGALMSTSDVFIPVESSYEALVADRLVLQGRSFEKPLRFTSEDTVHPDFILRDAQDPVYMEVFGMDSPKYLQCKRDKLADYASRGRALWCWDAASGSKMPGFPKKGVHLGTF
ncbi:DUF1173 family protein [Hydrogenophaga sp. NFH-34]|uniref:DUF1173 family protein n=1 Tax=Hydrogenophaga sp. NFH-34 TaxID=2744446 RepID=UPI001F3F5306|nr:DUF1173 family protein [Hydrogenophaga sp. NFH-34]